MYRLYEWVGTRPPPASGHLLLAARTAHAPAGDVRPNRTYYSEFVRERPFSDGRTILVDQGTKDQFLKIIPFPVEQSLKD